MAHGAHTPGEPIAEIIRRLTAQRSMTYRALAELTVAGDADHRGISHAYVAGIVTGRERPSPRSMRLIAYALEIPPETFAEYRLAQLRDELDERRVGLDAAWRRYRDLVG